MIAAEAAVGRATRPSKAATILFFKRMPTFSLLSPSRTIDDMRGLRPLHITLSRAMRQPAVRSGRRAHTGRPQPSGWQRFPMERCSTLRPMLFAGVRPIRPRVAEHDLEQFAEKPIDAWIGRTARLRPGGGFRQRLVVSTIDGIEIENARLVRPGTGRAIAHLIGAEIGGGIEDQH